jgi:hypothetical protein
MTGGRNKDSQEDELADMIFQEHWRDKNLRELIKALVRLSVNPVSHVSIILGNQGVNMQMIIEHLDDLTDYVMPKLADHFYDLETYLFKKTPDKNMILLDDDREPERDFALNFQSTAGVVTLFTNCLSSLPEIVH